MSGDGALLATGEGVERVRSALVAADLDGWLLYEFHGRNPVAARLLGLEWTTRRSFTLVPASGEPVALIHEIERSYWRGWPWRLRTYAGWREMEEALVELVGEGSRLAMEVSARSAVPTLDLVPAGIVELVRDAGVRPVSSGDLVSTFHATWSASQLEAHRRAAEVAADVAARAFDRAARAVRDGERLTEGELAAWIRGALGEEGVAVDVDCIVAVGPNAADPHYVPGEEGAPIEADRVLLVDLWGRTSERAVPADQTWMGYLGAEIPDDVAEVWSAVRDAREAVLGFLERRADTEVRGFEVDDVARELIDDRGFADRFVHRTGHSIDTELHGSGPNLDHLETRDERRLVHGVGFSVEPGIYLEGRFGIRSEVNVHWGEDGPEVTPARRQDEIFRLLDG